MTQPGESYIADSLVVRITVGVNEWHGKARGWKVMIDERPCELVKVVDISPRRVQLWWAPSPEGGKPEQGAAR